MTTKKLAKTDHSECLFVRFSRATLWPTKFESCYVSVIMGHLHFLIQGLLVIKFGTLPKQELYNYSSYHANGVWQTYRRNDVLKYSQFSELEPNISQLTGDHTAITESNSQSYISLIQIHWKSFIKFPSLICIKLDFLSKEENQTHVKHEWIQNSCQTWNPRGMDFKQIWQIHIKVERPVNWINRLQVTTVLLSRASKMGSPTNHPGSGQGQDMGPGILQNLNRRTDRTLDPFY